MQVGDALLDVIFDPDVADGAGLVIDGFPRTALQVYSSNGSATQAVSLLAMALLGHHFMCTDMLV